MKRYPCQLNPRDYIEVSDFFDNHAELEINMYVWHQTKTVFLSFEDIAALREQLNDAIKKYEAVYDGKA